MQIKVKQTEKISYSLPESQIRDQVPPHILRILKFSIIGLFAVGTLTVLLFQGLDWLRHSPLFELKNISIEGNYIVTRKEIVSAIVIPENPHLMNLPLEEFRSQIMENPWIADVHLSRVFPSTLRIRVKERKPTAIILGKPILFVDCEGMILPEPNQVRVIDLPCITGIKNLEGKPGEKSVHMDLITTLSMLEKLRSLDIGLWFKISELRWQEGSSFVIYLYDHGVPVRIPKECPLKERLYILNQFLKYLETEDKFNEIACIDLSYAGQVITKKQKQ